MTTRSTRCVVPLAVACAWLACASPAGAASPATAGAAALAPVAQSMPAASAAMQYTVKPGQSLADIAAAATQSHDKAVLARAAKSIFDANPSAFMRGDPSLLKLGVVLDVPALDATGAVVKAAPAPAASASAPNANPVGAAASQGAAVGAKASGAPATQPAPAPGATALPAPASAVAGASAAAKAAAAAVAVAPKTAPAAAPRPQPSAPSGASGGHAWAGAIQSAPATAAPASGATQTPAGAVGASAGVAASGSVNASSPTVASGGTAASAGAAASASTAVVTSAPRPTVTTSSVATPAVAASHPKVTSLQQLLALKNRVLMELQQHGVGAPSMGHPAASGSAPPVAASGFSAPPPASGVAAASAPGRSRAGAAANRRFIGIGGYGFSLARNDIPAVAAIAAAIVAALLVLLGALGISRRRRPVPPVGGLTNGSATGAASPAQGADAAQTSLAPAATADDPVEAEFLAILARAPSSKRALMGLAGHYAERKNVRGFDEIAQRIYRLSGGRGPNWIHVASIGRQLDPDNPLFALEAGEGEEDALTGADEPGTPAEPSSETSPAAAALDDGASTETAARAASPAVEAAPSIELVPPETVAPHAPAVEEEPQTAHPGRPGSHETAVFEATPAAEATGVPGSEATLPPEAIAALGDLDLGLPPRIGPAVEGGAYPTERAGEPEHEAAEPAAGSAASIDGAAHVAPTDAPIEHAEPSERVDFQARASAMPAVYPGVSGLGAAPVGRLDLSFDLDLPGAAASERGGEHADAAPQPQFTPEQLARIARNKLDLATEYIALGDLGGARTLIHEVIESSDAATHDDAHALLATLAPLS
ncbi:FimV/HubP family polar landmark protein [Trinickia acidisoli]|uniref:FimV/HubP family polar landmark protein n=1 Tax=Trinickia acidisoli TaxID=2767482 RepID=UPI001A8CF9DD|nr:FimV/HubP family polar landmark protein [Trinickia acidisoli]